jgi:hypothetical protein
VLLAMHDLAFQLLARKNFLDLRKRQLRGLGVAYRSVKSALIGHRIGW